MEQDVSPVSSLLTEKVAGADDKQKRVEEKRMLTVVKATLKAVLAQWKDAVKACRLVRSPVVCT